MATKHTDTCLQKAGDDEPIFVLRAQDRHAPTAVRAWAIAASEHCPDAKLQEALALADRMEAWALAHGGAKEPD